MSDLISRQAAIEAIADHDPTNGYVAYFSGREVQEIIKALPSADRPKDKYRVKGFTYLDLYQKAEMLLNRGEITLGEYEEMIEPLKQLILPDRPKGEWIPVSERLPVVGDSVLFQFEKTNMAVGFVDFDPEIGEANWAIWSGGDFYTEIGESEEYPIAWMPLPPQWKGDK